MPTATVTKPPGARTGTPEIRTALRRLRVRVGAEDLGLRYFPAGYTITDVVNDLPDLPSEISCVVVDDSFRYPQPLASALRITGIKQLFFTAPVPISILDYRGRKVLRETNVPALGLPLTDLPKAASVACGFATRSQVVVDGKTLSGRKLKRAGVVEAGHTYGCPDP